jgi:hypothetical protein
LIAEAWTPDKGLRQPGTAAFARSSYESELRLTDQWTQKIGSPHGTISATGSSAKPRKHAYLGRFLVGAGRQRRIAQSLQPLKMGATIEEAGTDYTDCITQSEPRGCAA